MMKKFSDSRGQAIVLTVLGAWLFALFGALAVDVGLYVNDRRDAQNDVDKAALAGALELTLDPSDTGAGAIAAAEEWAAMNGTPVGELTVNVVHADTCYAGSSSSPPVGVQVSTAREANSFLVGYLGITDWEASASAIACAGRPSTMIGLLPFALSESGACFIDGPGGTRVPRLGEYCNLVIDSNEQGLSGELGISTNTSCDDGNSSASVLEDNIINGTQVYCSVGESVQGNNGHNVGKTKSGIETRVAGEGSCEANFPAGDAGIFSDGNAALNAYSSVPVQSPSNGDGHDDFYEIWRYHGDPADPAANLAPYDCDPGIAGIQTSPRNAALIVIADWATPDGNSGPKSYIVQGFARVYIAGCSDSNDFFHKDCDWGGGGKFTIHARFVEQTGLTNSGLGYETEYGDIEVFLRQ